MGSQLCATAASATDGAKVTLEKCVFTAALQKFKNDYTRVRNAVEPFTLVASESETETETETASSKVCFYLPLHFKRIMLTILTCPLIY